MGSRSRTSFLSTRDDPLLLGARMAASGICSNDRPAGWEDRFALARDGLPVSQFQLAIGNGSTRQPALVVLPISPASPTDRQQDNFWRHPKANREDANADAGSNKQMMTVFKDVTGGVFAT